MSPIISIATLAIPILFSFTSKVQALSNCDEDNCVPVSECPHLWKLISKDKGTITQQETNTLREAHCGFQDKTPKVCCEPGVCKPSANLPDRHSGCCGNYSSTADRIVHFRGKNVSINQYPWLTYIDYLVLTGEDKGKTKFVCGGVLIGSKFALIAAHCVVGPVLDRFSPINVRLGEFDSDNEGNCSLTKDNEDGGHCGDGLIILPIEKTIPHPEYNFRSPQKRNDIALIKMKGLAPYTDIIRPICLPDVDITSSTLSSSPNFKFILAAWGKIDDKMFGGKIKFFQKVPYINMTVCQPYYNVKSRQVDLWENHICAGGEAHKDPCKVDGGGPLMYENDKVYEVHGVGSFGPSCGRKTTVPDVFTKVVKYTAWIRTTVDNEFES